MNDTMRWIYFDMFKHKAILNIMHNKIIFYLNMAHAHRLSDTWAEDKFYKKYGVLKNDHPNIHCVYGNVCI